MKELWQSLTSETEEILLKRGKEMCKKNQQCAKLKNISSKAKIKLTHLTWKIHSYIEEPWDDDIADL